MKALLLRNVWTFPVALAMLISGTMGDHAAPAFEGRDFAVIAHRGASGYAPEHTAVATAMAHAMGADFIEQDVAFTRDGRAVVIHDVILESTTDVADRFPGRRRDDGRFYVIDFTAAEIRSLRKGERTDPRTGKAVYPGRYPAGDYKFPLMFLEDAISLIRGLDKSTGRTTGVYPELKKPEFHLTEGLDPVPPFMEALKRSGALDGTQPCYIQCFHPETLRRIRRDYGPGLTLVQLIGRNAWKESSVDYDQLLSKAGLREVATYADGIGLPVDLLVSFKEGGLEWLPAKSWAREAGLIIHPYTLRRETIPEGFTYGQVLAFLAAGGGVDGLFTDFPDLRP